MGRSSSQSHSRWSTSRWATTLLLSMASSTASALSLSNFQVLTSPSIPISCILAYNSQIEGCRMSDFTKGNTCSQVCVDGLLKIQATLEYVCGDTRIRVDSVIGQALQGNLVRLLCPGNSSPGTTTIVSSPLPTPSSTRTRSPVATTVSTLSRSSSTLPTRVPSLTFTTVRPPTSSATSTQELDETETETESEPESSTTTATTATTATNDRGLTSSAPIPTFVQSELPVPTDQATSTTDISTPEPTADSGEETAAGLPDSGGGSPFDAFGASSSQPRQFVSRGFEAAMIALGISLLLLR